MLRKHRVIPDKIGSLERLMSLIEDARPVAVMGECAQAASDLGAIASHGVAITLPGWPLLAALLRLSDSPAEDLLRPFGTVRHGDCESAAQFLSALERQIDDPKKRVAAWPAYRAAFKDLGEWEDADRKAVFNHIRVRTGADTWEGGAAVAHTGGGIVSTHLLHGELAGFLSPPVSESETSNARRIEGGTELDGQSPQLRLRVCGRVGNIRRIMSVTYLDHFGLRQAPFGITPDPALFHNSQGHQRALDWIEDGVAARAPILSLTGAPGTGKTTLLRVLLDRHGSDWTIGLVPALPPRRDSILVQAHQALGLPDQGGSPGLSSDQIRRLAEATRAEDGFTLLMVDDAQALDVESISALASLALDGAKGSALTLLLVGRPELRSLLAAPRLRSLRMPESAHAVLPPLSAADTADYVGHRLALSGAGAPIFSLRATQMLHSLGMGVPRFINILADYCLTTAAAEGVSRLDRAWVGAVLHEASATGVLGRLAERAREGPPPSALHGPRQSPEPPVSDTAQHATAPDMAESPDHAAPLAPAVPDLAPATAAMQGVLLPAERHEEPETGQAASIGREGREPPMRVSGALRAVPRPDAAPPVAAAPTLAPYPAAHPAPPSGREPGRRVGSWLSAAALLLAGGATLVWLQSRPAPAPVATDPAPPPASATVDRAAAPTQPALSPTALQSAPALGPVAITPEPTVKALMQRALESETRDPAEAVLAYTRAALRGRARAAWYLGQLYETGTGVEPSPGLARLWYAAATALPAAQRRLQALPAAGAAAGAPAPPVPVFQARVSTGGSEMIWRVPEGGLPARFRVEMVGPAEKPLPVQDTTVPGLIVPFPVSAWRVIAIGADGTESAPSAMVRMIPARE